METRRRLYLLLTVIGALVPSALAVYFVAQNGPDPVLFVEEMFASTAATATLFDALIASVVFWVWLVHEAPVLGIRRWWLLIVANVVVGLSFALPLFLFLREGRRAEAARS